MNIVSAEEYTNLLNLAKGTTAEQNSRQSAAVQYPFSRQWTLSGPTSADP